MRHIYPVLAILVCLSVLGGCKKEISSPGEHSNVRTELKITIAPAVKTGLGEKDGSAYPNYWRSGDEVSVGGVASDPLGAEFDENDNATASFAFGSSLEAPYYAAYPASSISDYKAGAATITLPAHQTYIAGSYDPDAFLMTGRSDGTDITISPKVAIFHLSLTGSASINRIVLTGEKEDALSGTFPTDFETLTPDDVSSKVALESSAPVELPADFFICIPAGAYSTLRVDAYDADGCAMTKTARLNTHLAAGQMYSAPVLDYCGTEVNQLIAESDQITSCSAVFAWNHYGKEASFDVSCPYTVALFSDPDCNDLVVSHNIDAGAGCWQGKHPRFAFGGLDPGTTYYFKVSDTTLGAEISSDVIRIKTKPFAEVDATTVSNASVGDIILGENFKEICWGPSEFENAAGFIPSVRKLNIPTGENPDGSFCEFNSTGTYVSWADLTDGTRLSHDWGYSGNNSRYYRTGYLRICTTSSGARTHVVCPKLVGIPEGKKATIEVTLTVAKQEDNTNDVAVFLETGDLNSSCKMSASLSNGYPLGISSSRKWETKTVTIKNVSNANRLVVGPYLNVDTKNRFSFSDISVRLVDLYETPVLELKAKSTAKTSSTIVVSWTEGNGAADDATRAYTAKLYSDAACTNEVRSFDFPANCGAWKGNQPMFVFGGLTPSTHYWFKVTDTTNGVDSDVVEETTDAFTVVEMPSSISTTGVVLAEDFGELQWEFDYPSGAVGFRPSSSSSFANTSVKTSETNTSNNIYGGYHAQGGGEMTFKGQGTALSNSTRLNGWVTDSNVYIHPGYLKMGTSNARGWILTPEFTIPEGKKAIVKVTVTAGRYSSGQDSDWAVAVLNQALANANASSHEASFDWPAKVDDAHVSTDYQELSFTNNNSWATKSVSGLEVHPGDRIVFGGRHGGSSSTGRVQISDMTVEVISIVDDLHDAKKLSIIGDSISTFEGWLPSGNRVYSEYKIGGSLQDWTKTYWGALCTKYMSGYLQMEKNISWSGSCVAQDTRSGSSYRPAYVTRYGKSNVGTTYALNSIGSPDIVIIYGGTNDRYNASAGLSDVNSTPSDSDFTSIFAKSDEDLSVTSFVEAYVKLINMVHSDCPSAKIVNIIGDYVTVQQIASIKKISDHYSFCRYVDFSNGGSSNPKITKCNGVHPDINGMDYMAKTITNELREWMLE